MSEIVQQYPTDQDDVDPDGEVAKSLRINHPDWKDVYNTTYVKGVLSDFKVKSEDPFQVVSMVKVKIDDVETEEFIPLFYHPKKGYWDDRGYRNELGNLKDGEKDRNYATDFKEKGEGNEEEEAHAYFVKAWMSFRCGDEVVVMLHEGVPIAVVGFADGVPRPGENLFKMTGKEYYETDIAEKFYYAFNSLQENFTSYGTPYGTYPAGAELKDDAILPEGFDKDKICVTQKFIKKPKYISRTLTVRSGWYCVERVLVDNYILAVFANGDLIERHYSHDFYWAVGPVMFCWRITKVYSMADNCNYVLAVQHGSEWEPANLPDLWGDEWDVDPLTLGFKPENIEPCDWRGEHEIPTHPELPPFSWEDYPTYEDDYYSSNPTWTWIDGVLQPFNQPFYCAVYKPELWENPDYKDMVLQEVDFYWFALIPRWVQASMGYSWDPESYEIYVPPHTKAELQAADMWPEEEEIEIEE